MYQIQHCFVITFLWITLLCNSQALANSCQVYPSEYAYLKESVTAFERLSANCTKYPKMTYAGSATAEDFTHCNGIQLKLLDSVFESRQYNSRDYYVWPAGSSASQLLFIFQKRINLNIITVHYYSDKLRGLPRLRFYAVPDDFNVWDAPSTSYSHIDILSMPPDNNTMSAGSKNICANMNINTKKVLMYKFTSTYSFSCSEVEFRTTVCAATCNTLTTMSPSQPNTVSNVVSGKTQESNSFQYQHTTDNSYTTSDMLTEQTTTQQDSDFSQQDDENNSHTLSVGVVVTVLSLTAVVCISVLVVLLLLCHKRTQKNKSICNPDNRDDFYSTLDRGTEQPLQTQPEGLCTELYDHIQLSPSTGQPELTESDNESKNTHVIVSSPQLDRQNTGKPYKTEQGNSKSEFATYAIVDKKKKTRSAKEVKSSKNMHRTKHQQNQKKENVEETYAAVQKKSKKYEKQAREEIAPPVPLHTIESLYTAVQKNQKCVKY